MSFPITPCPTGALKQYDRRCHGKMDCPSKPTRFWLSKDVKYVALCEAHTVTYWNFMGSSDPGPDWVEVTLQELEVAEVQES